MIQKIKAKSFSIQDPSVIDFMRTNQIHHLRFDINIDDGAYISAHYPDYNKLASIEKCWFKIHWGKRVVCVRNPSMFKDSIGKEVEVYKDNIFKKSRELFRIRPIGFNVISSFKERRRRVKINSPYFSNSGYCVIPRDYIVKKDLVDIFRSKLSFNRTNEYLVGRGLIFARITKDFEPGGLMYSLRECSNGVCTRFLKEVKKIVSEKGSKLKNFQYEDTMYDENYKYNLIIFKEIIPDGDE